jgi:hypothetical protein
VRKYSGDIKKYVRETKRFDNERDELPMYTYSLLYKLMNTGVKPRFIYTTPSD